MLFRSGSAVWLVAYCTVRASFTPPFLEGPATRVGIAAAHTVFNVLCTLLMLPLSGFLEWLVNRLIPDAQRPEARPELDERLLSAPHIALGRCREVAADMAKTAVSAFRSSLAALRDCTPELAASVREQEEKTDHYEDILGDYLVKLSARQIGEADSAEAAKLLKIIGDFERIADHAVNLLESAEEIRDKKLRLTGAATAELDVLSAAVTEILELSLTAFLGDDLNAAAQVEPLEEVIDQLKEQLRTRHILRLQQGACTIGTGFAWSDLLTDLERTADHCSNIAGSIIDAAGGAMNPHRSLRELRSGGADFSARFNRYREKYALEPVQPR